MLITWLLMMGIAFMGYVLPWGLMSYWALTVITNLMTVIPVIGSDVLCCMTITGACKHYIPLARALLALHHMVLGGLGLTHSRSA